MPRPKPTQSQSLWQRACAFAARAHRHQVRKDGATPYFSHVSRVALTLSYLFGCDDEVVLAAALLHDTIEDTQTDYDDIAKYFGVPVADCVAALTKNMILPETRRERDYYERLRRADWRARLVKLADAYDNYSDRIHMPDQARKTAKRLREAIALVEPDARKRQDCKQGVRAARLLLRRRSR